MMKKPFATWMAEVDQWLYRMVGVVSADLPDYCYRDAYDDGRAAQRVAKSAVRAAQEF